MIWEDKTGNMGPLKEFMEHNGIPTDKMFRITLYYGKRFGQLTTPNKEQKSYSIKIAIPQNQTYPKWIEAFVRPSGDEYGNVIRHYDNELAECEQDNMVFMLGRSMYIFLRRTKKLKGKGRTTKAQCNVHGFDWMRNYKRWRETGW